MTGHVGFWRGSALATSTILAGQFFRADNWLMGFAMAACAIYWAREEWVQND